MAKDDLLHGHDDLLVPMYLVTDPDAPALQQWKREHPDWFIAGTWTAGPARAVPLATTTSAPQQPPPGQDETARDEDGAGHFAPWMFGRALAGSRSAAPIIPRRVWPGSIAADAAFDNRPGFFTVSGQTLHGPPNILFAGPGAPPNAVWIQEVTAQIVIISRTVTALFDQEVVESGKQMTPTEYGTKLHNRIAKAIEDAHIPGVEVEQSFKNGGDGSYAELGSKRTDVILRDRKDLSESGKGRIIAVWDFKTGLTAIMSERRKREIRAAIDSDLELAEDIPIYLIHTRVTEELRSE